MSFEDKLVQDNQSASKPSSNQSLGQAVVPQEKADTAAAVLPSAMLRRGNIGPLNLRGSGFGASVHDGPDLVDVVKKLFYKIEQWDLKSKGRMLTATLRSEEYASALGPEEKAEVERVLERVNSLESGGFRALQMRSPEDQALLKSYWTMKRQMTFSDMPVEERIEAIRGFAQENAKNVPRKPESQGPSLIDLAKKLYNELEHWRLKHTGQALFGTLYSREFKDGLSEQEHADVSQVMSRVSKLESKIPFISEPNTRQEDALIDSYRQMRDDISDPDLTTAERIEILKRFGQKHSAAT